MAKWVDADSCIVRIPNDEVLSEFQILITEMSGVDRLDLQRMFQYLLDKEMDKFLSIYRNIVISCTSYMDAKENAYHMLFLGMCISPKNINVIVEFKQGEDLESLKNEALSQILDQKYYVGLRGEVLCVGLAHDKKRCEMEHKEMTV